MNSKVIVIAISLVAVVVCCGCRVLRYVNRCRTSQPLAIPSNYFDQSAATEDRVFALEAAVAQERNARLLLEEELQALY